ncbi:putative phage tail protein [Exiguobacterium sp. UBA5002]|uniref:putative phage tail protein n=1 Tax=Exiguobacterium sp. UBA5002 TaxID=1946497 RepID=UPI0025C2D7EA|nr:putative phage tail protein [Exiguobacterium sp. UBA5002]
MNEEELKERLFEHVYPVYRQSAVWQSIYGAQAKELIIIEALQEELEAQLDLERATWALSLWERDYRVESSDGTEEERRKRIKSKIGQGATPNERLIETIVDSYLEAFISRVENIPNEYAFWINFPVEGMKNFSDMREAIQKVKPSHLEMVLRLSSAESLRIVDRVRITARTYRKVNEWRIGQAVLKSENEVIV